MSKEVMKNIALCMAGKYESTNCVKCGCKIDLIDFDEGNTIKIEATWEDGTQRKVLIPVCDDCFEDVLLMLSE